MSSAGPRAVGVRTTYAAVPARVRAFVDDALGSPVVATAEQVGGFSPGCATRVTCADGTRAFVKAVGAELNPDTPTLFRREVDALTRLGSHPLWADLLASYDDGPGGWVALVLEDVDGTHPDLADDVVMGRLLEATDELGRVLRERQPDLAAPPARAGDDRPALFRPGPVDLRQVFADWSASCAHVGALPADLAADLVPRWVVARADELRARVAALAGAAATSPVHFDVRDDNLLVRPDGSVVFVDWGASGVGPDWLDPLLARLERVHLAWFDESLASSPALVRAGDDTVTWWLAGIGTHLAWRAHTAERQPGSLNLPTLSAFRRRESARFLAAAARRLRI